MKKLKFKTFGTPVLVVSDNPCLTSGLARMGRDLASLLCTMPEFSVGYLGRGLGQKRKLPFMLYDYPESGGWGEGVIEYAWNDFSRGEPGVIITLDDISRRHWFANPYEALTPGPLQEFLGHHRNFQKWGYFPVDSIGPNGKPLSFENMAALAGYERIAAASEWGKTVINAPDWIPHGIWTDKFHPISNARNLTGQSDNDIWVGCVMANQSRKDFPVMAKCFADLRDCYPGSIKFWIHTDEPIRYWNIYSLLANYGLTNWTRITTNLTDDELALRYSSCACTVLPSAGEGFGYPIAESMACGTACIVTDYAAGPELVPAQFRVPPVGYRIDTQHNCCRAVLDGTMFAIRASVEIDAKMKDWSHRAAELSESVAHLDWNKLQHVWKKWLLEGIREN